MDEIDVPPFFICPISLEIMKDPVTVPTGITYDRENIEKWLISGKKNTACPVTKQAISDCELVPNHTLRRLIQSWCTLNACHGIERIPTPKPPITKDQITKLLDDAKSPLQQMKCLVRLRFIASENDTNKRCIESSGAVSHRRACEMILTVLDEVCRCAEGRSELLNHGVGLAVVSKKILRVSQVANQRAVRILWCISKFCGTCDVVQEMVQLGIVAKLCLVLQTECGHKTKEKAREVLKLHAKLWMNSPCIPTNLLSSYPA
ncbi:E3 ubiquitin-protein ligase PUB22 [Hibiscus syriacus]|uniref:U-box domain-containing protein n=1 Tax=Hibiscus syriacus TaxID=106335 RepID=A0A6A2Y0G5_HIBSY|nr:E3 ubiquitin-protein ligase PUB22-like [Hibiscus syriacus]KAE8660914.1 E3 ubiquitin-protein ligase PUB22 [Hibiscus syriacus]